MNLYNTHGGVVLVLIPPVLPADSSDLCPLGTWLEQEV